MSQTRYWVTPTCAYVLQKWQKAWSTILKFKTPALIGFLLGCMYSISILVMQLGSSTCDWIIVLDDVAVSMCIYLWYPGMVFIFDWHGYGVGVHSVFSLTASLGLEWIQTWLSGSGLLSCLVIWSAEFRKKLRGRNVLNPCCKIIGAQPNVLNPSLEPSPAINRCCLYALQ